jgi:(p)ppGpp synthase/HD superfamily hydrolase
LHRYNTDSGLDMVEAKVNGVAVGFDWTLSNADVVEIITQEYSGLKFESAGEATASVGLCKLNPV